MSPEEIFRLERVAFASWPAAETEAYGGILLRHTGGESHRANSAATHAWSPDLEIERGILHVEAFYRARGRVPEIQVGPLAPPGLDLALAERGYERVAPVFAQTAALAPLTSDHADPRVNAVVLAAPDAAWTDVEVTRGRFAAIAETFLSGMRGLGARAGFGVVRVDGGVGGACLAFVEDGILLLAAMRVLPEARRRGAARALVRASATWGRSRGATLSFLQVEDDNVAALALYASFGFETQYRYHYRMADPECASKG